ncbi:hypothetical protein, partial [Paracoccus solventivorans]|uniref:hypothetical protein n=1 Tax=Paracoccus solventivorans TaxID=53463 RepID=UPI0026EA5D25
MARIRHEKDPVTLRQTGEIPAEPGAIVADAAASPQAAAAGERAATVARRTRRRAADSSDAVPQQAGATDPAAAGKAEIIQKGDSTMEQDDSPAPRR